jgi:putative IMPACT (imprinted ancient) family translation regulator
VRSIEEAKLAYKAISIDPTAAACTHLISAFWLGTHEEGYEDDHDHGLGRHLLGVMQKLEMVNSICFLTREYRGQHLGFRRYQIIAELAEEIFEKVTQKKSKPRPLRKKKRICSNKGRHIQSNTRTW